MTNEPMSPQRHARIKELFLRAIELDGEARQGFLQQQCGEDTSLQAEVSSLLAHHDPRSILTQSVGEQLGLRSDDAASGESPSGVNPHPFPAVVGRGLENPLASEVLSLGWRLKLSAVVTLLALAGLAFWSYHGIKQ